MGMPELRQGIAQYSSRLHGRTVTADRIAVTSSGVSALMLASQAIVSPGSRVVVVTPVWPNIGEIQQVLGADLVRFPLEVVHGKWSLDIERLLETLTPDTAMVVINSPSNPTGWVIEQEHQLALLRHCRKHGIWILSDEVYERLIYDGSTSTPSMIRFADAEDRLVTVNSFSKAWRMTGWRLGWLTVPAALSGAIEKLIEYNTSCVPAFVQRGGIAAISDPRGEEAIRSLVDDLTVSRRALREGLQGFEAVELPEADGAMYAFFRVCGRDDSVAFAKELVTKVGLGLAPGSAFGPEGNGWLRWCFAARPERISAGLDRLDGFLKRQ
jgi:aspartate/methionine/tyrosine aminotransferase